MPMPAVPGTPGIPGMAAIGDMDVGVDMGGAMGIEICIGMGIDIGTFAGAVVDEGCKVGAGDPKAPGDAAGKPGVADKAGELAMPAEPNRARELGSGLCDAPSPPAALDTIIL